jgi:hypothetical protein
MNTIIYVISMVVGITWGWPFAAFLGIVYLTELLFTEKFASAFLSLCYGAVLSCLIVIVTKLNQGPVACY